MSDEVQGRIGKESLAHTAEYLALRGTVRAMNALPWLRAGQLGAAIGTLGFRPLGIRRSVVESQLRASFPELPDEEILRISRASYAHLGRTAIETALLPSLTSAQILELVPQVTGWNVIEDAVRLGRGIILVTGHLGNWELGGAYRAAHGESEVRPVPESDAGEPRRSSRVRRPGGPPDAARAPRRAARGLSRGSGGARARLDVRPVFRPTREDAARPGRVRAAARCT